jgi:hypothetical protein
VNVEDFKAPTLPGGDSCRLTAIFGRQRELMEKYELIEKENRLLETEDVPVDIHDRFGQARLKNFAWRFTEELAEAGEALDEKGPFHLHTREELMDSLHFLVELMILAGCDSSVTTMNMVKYDKSSAELLTNTYSDLLEAWFMMSSVVRHPTPIDKVAAGFSFYRLAFWDVTQALGSAMNCLKQKPWKQSHILTDEPRFYGELGRTFLSFGRLLQVVGLTTNEVYDLYFRKSEVNKFRQDSKY